MKLARRQLLGFGLALPAMPALADTGWPSALVMGTGRPGGDYMLYGPAWGQLIQQQTGIGMAYRASGGAEANILLIDENTAQLGLTTSVIAHEARLGSDPWTGGARFSSFRALFPMFPSVLQIVSPRATGIATLAALTSQDIGVGPLGSSGSAILPALFKSVGVIPRSIITGDYADQLRDMIAGKLAACAFVGAPPVPAIADIAMGRKLSLIGFSAAEAAQVTTMLPGMIPAILEAGLFPGQTIAVASVGTANIAIGRADLPDTLVQAITLAALRNRSVLASTVPAAAAAPDLKSVTEAGIDFHPGAAMAFRSVGLDIPKEYIEP
jgi:TRAP transporter TAXI family solute receptor